MSLNMNKKLKRYHDFILFTHGQDVIDKLDKNIDIDLTNELLEIRDPVQFEEIRNQIIEDYEESLEDI